ncbi:ClpXP protease specificity-enhancing factor SspB [Facilibium subflavum]|uniref:ClpXP protease specificity-enhancing factor SspB n=1 Tax=Facilibium subflavum TaxID=2219058 RepID=UPI000E6553B1|nr:ClpXP protease specificity-enhancing factor SspB [Facilibium subflavum]
MAMLRAYLVEATYDWLVDHGFTPYMLIDTEYENVIVPEGYIDEDGKILLNLSPDAISDFHCDNEKVTFHATFDGDVMSINIPIESILELYSGETEQGLYAREFGYGINVNEGESDDDVNPPSNKSASKGKGGLRLV